MHVLPAVSKNLSSNQHCGMIGELRVEGYIFREYIKSKPTFIL